MKKFKIDDKVKIPKRKSYGLFSTEDFIREISDYELDYLIVNHISENKISLNRCDDKLLVANLFDESDLEHYEEPYVKETLLQVAQRVYNPDDRIGQQYKQCERLQQHAFIRGFDKCMLELEEFVSESFEGKQELLESFQNYVKNVLRKDEEDI